MPRQMVVLGPGALAGEGSAKRGFSPCLPPELPSRTLPWSVSSWPAVSCLWDGTTFALLAGQSKLWTGLWRCQVAVTLGSLLGLSEASCGAWRAHHLDDQTKAC